MPPFLRHRIGYEGSSAIETDLDKRRKNGNRPDIPLRALFARRRPHRCIGSVWRAGRCAKQSAASLAGKSRRRNGAISLRTGSL